MNRNDPSRIKDLEKRSRDAMRSVIVPTDSEEDLEHQKHDYESMPKKNRREADWMSFETRKMNNMDVYNKNRGELLNRQTKPTITGEYDGTGANNLSEAIEFDDNNYNFDKVKYTNDNIEAAKSYTLNSMITIIIPTDTQDELEELMYKYNSMIRKHQRESDWKSLELFGIDNITHYRYLLSKFLEKDIPEIEVDPIMNPNNTIIENKYRYLNSLDILADSDYIIETVTKDISEELSTYDFMNAEAMLDKTLHRVCNYIQIENKPTINTDMPFYTPCEIYDNEIYKENDINIEWFNDYVFRYLGLPVENKIHEWKMAIRSNMSLLETHIDDSYKDIIRNQIIELGWNPSREFSPENIKAVVDRHHRIAENYTSISNIKDISYLLEKEIIEVQNKYSYGPNGLKPLFIVLIEGNTIFSDIVKKTTKGDYSHAAIGFEPNLEKLYSFNMKNDDTLKGGLSIENVKNYPKDNKLAVYAIFIKDKEYKAVKDILKRYEEKIKDTSYNYLNLLSLVFNIPRENRDDNMICSQFVDRLLKMVNIDITDKDSSLVNPNDFVKVQRKNKYIYSIYKGIAKKYNVSRISNHLDKISANANYIKELAINFYGNNIRIPRLENFIIRPVLEEKEFPIQFDDDGNLLIKNIKSIDFHTEFSRSHKMLLQYHKNDNIEGMKYELSKLWYMNIIIEERLRLKRYKSQYKEMTDARALILNDFNKYMNYVLEEDDEFNFIKYYEDSPFSDETIKFRSSTIKYTLDILKKLV